MIIPTFDVFSCITLPPWFSPCLIINILFVQLNMLMTLQDAANYSSSTHSNECDSTSNSNLTVGIANSSIWRTSTSSTLVLVPTYVYELLFELLFLCILPKIIMRLHCSSYWRSVCFSLEFCVCIKHIRMSMKNA